MRAERDTVNFNEASRATETRTQPGSDPQVVTNPPVGRSPPSMGCGS